MRAFIDSFNSKALPSCCCNCLVFSFLTVILQLWRSADAVCFDVDSTVCLDEGIDELAEFCGAGKAVADWTARLISVVIC